MIETTMELVDGPGQGIVPIHEIGMDDGPDGLFTPITDVADAVCTGPLLGKLVFLVTEPLQGLERLIDLRASPPTERFDRVGVGGQMVLAPIQIAGTGDGDALGHGIEASLTFKFLLKGFTTGFLAGNERGHCGEPGQRAKGSVPLSFLPSCHRDRKTPNRGCDPHTVDGPGY